MSYTISVPVMNSTLETYGREDVTAELKAIGANRVFLCPSGGFRMLKDYEKQLDSLKTNVEYLKSLGYEVGIWVWAFQYKNGDFCYMKSPTGKVSKTSVCPTDKAYCQRIGDFVEDAAKLGIDLFMFDDDFRYSFIDCGFACCCDNHLRIISDDLGEEVTIETMREHLLHGGKNKYRDAFVKANGKALADFAARMRARLDNVNPSIRMGFCACISSWDMDGIHPDKLAEILAGNTKPFYRMIGAPYWVHDRNWGNRLGDVIELERMEAHRRHNPEIEIFTECDTYPRPRFRTPAAYVEGFDTALRAAGCTDGILKYIIDYSAHPLYETGYIEKHVKNKPLYEEIDNYFSNKKNTGLRVYDIGLRYPEYKITHRFDGSEDVQNVAFSMSARFATGCSLPTKFEGRGCGIAFGADVKAVPEEALSDGLIIDLAASEILQEMGIDTGVRSVSGTFIASQEIYADGNHVGLCGEVCCTETVPDEKAIIESRYVGDGKDSPASFKYENKQGQRFLVLCVDAYDCMNGENFYRQYSKAKQVIDAVPWLSGKPLPAVVTGCPDLYIQVKENNDAYAVGLWNFFPDDLPEPIIELGFEPKDAKAYGCEATIDNKKIKLSRIEPYGFAMLEITKA